MTNKDLLVKYNDVIQNQVELGVIEKPAKDTIKSRVVYDPSVKAKKGAKSLNKCLYHGPVFYFV